MPFRPDQHAMVRRSTLTLKTCTAWRAGRLRTTRCRRRGYQRARQGSHHRKDIGFVKHPSRGPGNSAAVQSYDEELTLTEALMLTRTTHTFA